MDLKASYSYIIYIIINWIIWLDVHMSVSMDIKHRIAKDDT